MKEVCRAVFVFSLVAVLFVFSFHIAVADTTAAAAGTTTTTTTPPAATTTTASATTNAQTTTAISTTQTPGTGAGTSTTTTSTGTAATLPSTATASIGVALPTPSSSTSAIPEKYANEKLEGSTSLTPGGFFYGWEKYVRAPFRSDEDNARQKSLEVKSAVEKGDIGSAKKAFESYKNYASKIEKEADPAKKDKIQKDAAAIRNTMNDIASKITDEKDRKEIVGGVVAQAELNAKAVDIAGKIKVLCEELSKTDKGLFKLTCSTTGNKEASQWQKDLNQKLTDDQKKEVKQFGEVMGQCIRTQGKECKCEDITDKEFALRCSVVAPLADACHNKGDKAACEKMDDATRGMEDLLPEYLQDAFAVVQRDINKEQFSQFVPQECAKAGAKTADDCMKIMFELHAPQKCKDALKNGQIKGFKSERDAKEQCEQIMLQDAPECVSAGVKDPQECATLMCKSKLPQQCADAGITCDDRNAPHKCEELMKQGGQGKNPRFASSSGSRCGEIQNAGDRLKCFDSVDSAMSKFQGQVGGGFEGQFNGDFGNGDGGRGGPRWPQECTKVGATTKETCEKVMTQNRQGQFNKQKEFVQQCMNKGGRWDCSYSSIDRDNPCRCFEDSLEGSPRPQDQRFGSSREQGSQNFPEQCRQAGATTPEACRKIMDQWGQQQSGQNEQQQREFQKQQEQFRQQQEQFRNQQDQFKNQQPPQGQFNCPPGQQCPPSGQPPQGQQPFSSTQQPQTQQSQSSTSTTSDTSTTLGTSGSTATSTTTGGSTSPSPSSSPPSGGASVTGHVVDLAGDNSFLNYYFKK